MMTIQGFVFDFDGLILDTEKPHLTAWQETFSQFGQPLLLQDWWKLIGTGTGAYDPAEDLFHRLKGEIDLNIVKQQVILRTEQLMENQILLPGVEAFIQSAYKKRIPMAIASSSPFEWVNSFIKKFHLSDYFKAIVTARDVEKVKPDPALYSLAVEKIGLLPNFVIAFEDSLNGIKAAKAAGIYCFAIPNSVTRGMDLSIADRIVASFEQISVEELCLVTN
ncbi:MAG: HAD family hydrolase [Anaerolineaceae bacterium]